MNQTYYTYSVSPVEGISECDRFVDDDDADICVAPRQSSHGTLCDMMLGMGFSLWCRDETNQRIDHHSIFARI